MGHRREIDGLRAVAVLPVMLFHAGFETFSGGYAGVDVFFVISGYLITGVLLRELSAGTFSLVGFYERRARRILPALFFVVLVCLPFAWLWLLPPDLKLFSESVASVALYASNLLFYSRSGYFDPAADLSPLLHTWSLGVEEQFYLLYPVFFALAWRLGSRRLVALLAVAFTVSLGVAHWASATHPSAAFYLLPTRMWELVLGALAAIYLLKRGAPASRYASEAGAAIGLGAIGLAVVLFDQRTPWPSAFTLLPAAGTTLVILCARPTHLTGRLLCHKYLVGIGLISYSAYLWHQPLFAFAKHSSYDRPPQSVFGALVVASLVLAFFSWRYVETPARDHGRFTRRQIFQWGAAASLFLLVVGGVGKYTNGFDTYYYSSRLSEVERRNYLLVNRYADYNLYENMVDDGACTFWSRTVDDAFMKRFEVCAQRHGKAVAVIGDSHGMNAYNIVAKAHVRPFVVGIAQGGCRPDRIVVGCPYDGFLDFLEAHRRFVELVVFHQSGAYLLSDAGGTVYHDSRHRSDPDRFALDMTAIGSIQAYLTRFSVLAPTVWLGPFVEAGVSFAKLGRFNDGFAIDDKAYRLFLRTNTDLAVQQRTGAHNYGYVPFEDVFDIDRHFLRSAGCITYFDTEHLSDCGESLIAARVADAFGLLTAAASDHRTNSSERR